MSQESEIYDCEEFTNSNDNIQQVDVNLENLEIEITDQSENILYLHKHNKDTEHKNNVDISDNAETLLPETNNNENDTNGRLQPQSVEISDTKNIENERVLEPQSDEANNSPDTKIIQLNKMCSSDTAISSISKSCEDRKVGDTNKINKSKKCKPRKTAELQQNNIYVKLAMHVEQRVKEWVTKNTLCLLMGETDERNQLLEKLMQHDRYQQLCKKLNKLELEDEKEDRIDLERNERKPLPHFSVLQEDGKKMELKVRAFYEGQMTIALPEDSNKESESKNNDNPILPLTDAHAPNALRRRIFLYNLNKILPDLMRALTTNANISSLAQCTYNNEKYSLIKILIKTFNLSASNIVFKTAEWTLVGLIVIKMLSLIDTQLQSLLRSKQASMYTSMILTTYKLDSNYLDQLIMEVRSNVDASNNKSSDEQC